MASHIEYRTSHQPSEPRRLPLPIWINEAEPVLALPLHGSTMSSQDSALHLVQKKDGSYRPCVDYRRLNDVTIRDAYPLVRIDDCLQFLQGSRYFTTIDLKSGYWQLRVAEEDRDKTTFTSRHGLYRFLVMPFGLKNAPASFQRMTSEILKEGLDKDWMNYLDDFMIHAKTLEELKRKVRRVIELLNEHDLSNSSSPSGHWTTLHHRHGRSRSRSKCCLTGRRPPRRHHW